MPYSVKQLPSGQWVKIKTATGKIVSRHKTKSKAQASIRAEYARTGESFGK